MKRCPWTVMICLLVAVAASGCSAAVHPSGPASPAPTAVPTMSGPSSASPDRIARPFALLRLPVDSQVVCTRDAVTWRVPLVQPAGSSLPVAAFWRFDVCTRQATRDDWLTALLGRRRMDSWFLSGSRAAWLDTTGRLVRADGQTVVAARLETATAPSTVARTLAGPSWGGLQEDADDSTQLLAFDGRLCWLFDDGRRIDANGSLSEPRHGGEWLVDVNGRRCRLGHDVGLLALTGDTMYWAAGQSRATDFGSRTLQWGSLGARGLTRHAVHAPALVTAPAAADRSAVAFTAVPPDSTDLADGRVWAYEPRARRWWEAPASPGQQVLGVGDGFVAYLDERHWTASQPRDDLWAADTTGRGRPVHLASPATEIEGSDVTMIGDEVFWTLPGDGCTLVYGARLVRHGGTVTARPL